MTIGGLRPGQYDLTLSFRKGGEKRVRGEVVEGKTGKHFIARCSPKVSFAPSTKVLRHSSVQNKEGR